MVGLALIAVFTAAWTICGVTAATAFAEGQWAANGEAITTALAIDLTGTLHLINLKSAGGAVLVEVECNGLFEGTVGSAGAGSITDLVNLSAETIGGLGDTNERKLNCTVTATAKELGDCTATGELAEALPTNLNLELSTTWTTSLESMESTILDKLPATSGYEVKCKTSLGELENKCEGSTSALLQNAESEKGVLGLFNSESGTTSCSLTGTSTGKVEGSGIITLTNGETLTVRGPAPVELVDGNPDFGSVVEGEHTKFETFKFETKFDTVKYNEVMLFNKMGSAFSLGADECNGKVVGPAGTCEIGVFFTPVVEGEYTASLQIAYLDETTGELWTDAVPLEGLGIK
jgi:hypothetical protein